MRFLKFVTKSCVSGTGSRFFFWISRLRASGVKWLWESYCSKLTSIGPKIDSHTPKTDYQIPKLNPEGLNSTLRDQISTFTFRNLNRTSRGKKSNVKAKNHSKRRKFDSKSKRPKFSSCRCKIDFWKQMIISKSQKSNRRQNRLLEHSIETQKPKMDLPSPNIDS